MFNNLNNVGGQNRPTVDDIFAETDKSQEGGALNAAGSPSPSSSAAASGGEIETQRIGLTAEGEAAEEAPESGAAGKWFKIVLILIIAAILVLGGYLAYTKFFNAAPVDLTPAPVVKDTTTATPAPAETGSFVTPTGGNLSTVNPESSTVSSSVIPEIPGVNAPALSVPTTTAETSVTPAVSLIDSDSDGLTDSEEKTAGTNINVIDTDVDGLSDYEEVKIYKTNPLVADTDGDGYLDGVEVKGGYNPNGKGMLSDASSTPETGL